MNAFAHVRRHGQHGAALLVGLVLLLVLTITALVAMQLVSNQNRVAGNAWGSQMSLGTGEAALSNAENALLGGTLAADFAAGAGGAYTLDPNAVPQWANPAFAWSGANVLAGVAFSNSVVPPPPPFSPPPPFVANAIAEQLPSVAGPGQSLCTGYNCNGGITQVYRVTSKAVGPGGTMPTLLQDTSVQ